MKGVLIAVALFGCALAACQKDVSADQTEIRALLHAQFDQPGTTLELHPVAVSGATSVVDWTQGPKGGRALLRKREGKWYLSMCGGAGLKTADGLTNAGVSGEDAKAIASSLAAAEAKMTSARLAQLDSFGETVRMDAGEAHKGH